MTGQPSFPVDLGPIAVQTLGTSDYGQFSRGKDIGNIYDTQRGRSTILNQQPSQIPAEEGFGTYSA